MLKRLFAILLLVVATGTIPAASQSRYAWKDTYVTTSMNPVNNPRANDGIEVYTRPGGVDCAMSGAHECDCYDHPRSDHLKSHNKCRYTRTAYRHSRNLYS